MIHHFVSEAEGVCGASVLGYVATQFELVWLAVFGPAGLVDSVSGVMVIVGVKTGGSQIGGPELCV